MGEVRVFYFREYELRFNVADAPPVVEDLLEGLVGGADLAQGGALVAGQPGQGGGEAVDRSGAGPQALAVHLDGHLGVPEGEVDRPPPERQPQLPAGHTRPPQQLDEDPLGSGVGAVGRRDEHLGDPALDPESIAAAHFISRRHLDRLFADGARTVAETIRDRRLERCRRDLEDPRRAGDSVLDIANRWGFVSPAHFSRAFRAAYGMTPRELRQTKMRPPSTTIV